MVDGRLFAVSKVENSIKAGALRKLTMSVAFCLHAQGNMPRCCAGDLYKGG
jgi:hypothetical protein